MSTIIFKPRQCSSISEWNSDDILRQTDAGALYVSRYQNPGDAFRSLLQFDLGLLPIGKPYNTAYLQLFIYRNQIARGTIKASIYPLFEAWDENGLTWNHRPSAAETAIKEIIIPAGWTGFILFDISKLLQSWLDGSLENYGLMIAGDESRDRLVAFASSAYPQRDKHPQLILIPEEDKQDYGLV